MHDSWIGKENIWWYQYCGSLFYDCYLVFSWFKFRKRHNLLYLKLTMYLGTLAIGMKHFVNFWLFRKSVNRDKHYLLVKCLDFYVLCFFHRFVNTFIFWSFMYIVNDNFLNGQVARCKHFMFRRWNRINMMMIRIIKPVDYVIRWFILNKSTTSNSTFSVVMA